ncbi:MAG: hypothetical protein ACREWI_18500 [Telluria sp.]
MDGGLSTATGATSCTDQEFLFIEMKAALASAEASRDNVGLTLEKTQQALDHATNLLESNFTFVR